jgi:hypothetical protein
VHIVGDINIYGWGRKIRGGSHGVPSPTHISKSQLLSLKNIMKIFVGFVLRVGSSFLLDLILNTSPKPHLQKMLSCSLGGVVSCWSSNIRANK